LRKLNAATRRRQSYKEKTGYEIPDDLKFKEGRLAKIRAAKKRLSSAKNSLILAKPSTTPSKSVLRYRSPHHGRKAASITSTTPRLALMLICKSLSVSISAKMQRQTRS